MKEETTMKDNWKGIKKTLTLTGQKMLGRKKHHHRVWISIETLEKIQERTKKKTAINNSQTRTEKIKAHTEYTEVNKQMKKSNRADKQKYVGELATTVEKSAKEGNIEQLYDTKKIQVGKYSRLEGPVKDKK
ncbi:unnamed protein product [Schistosoma mattheei]|uniref:Uncharacterized protein n=1 Tax=Schistosoma mattheei TaxID=31246 RepID=A0A3P8FJQ7_9TREM|nr:unnamed protein product [Schistosoma mattheei]